MHGQGPAEGDYTYSCFGLRIRSKIALPEISTSPAPFDDRDRPVVEIRFGAVPETLPDARRSGHGLQVDGGDVLLRVKDTARFLVREGREIVVDATPGGSPRNVRLFLLGSAFGILCHQRGLLPLHANAIVVNGATVAFAGSSGAGKSTLAAYFQRAGYEILCDDVCVVSFDADGRPAAWPGLPRLKLWRDAAASFGHESDGLERAVDGLEKYHVPFSRLASAGPFPFERLYVLQVAEPGLASEITRLRGAVAYETILSQTYRSQYLGPMGLSRRHLDLGSALLKHAQVYSAPRRWGYEVFAQEVGKIERHLLGT